MMVQSAFVALLLSLLKYAHAQVGVSICACQPDSYEFTLDFSLTCQDMDVVAGQPGILDTACVLNTEGNENVTDFTPVIISEVQILELDQNLNVIFQTTVPGDLASGDKFNYTSITATQARELNDTSVPAALQLFLTGRNAQEQDLVNFYAILYDNACGIWPLLEEGQTAGWTIFSGLGTPSQFICPAAPAEPTDVPATDSPSDMPSASPTEPGETDAPTPTPPVTDAPTATPGTPAPTEAPTATPGTEAPTATPGTEAPTTTPLETGMPSALPTFPGAPSCPPSDAPVGDGPKGNRDLKTGNLCVEPIDIDEVETPPGPKGPPKLAAPVVKKDMDSSKRGPKASKPAMMKSSKMRTPMTSSPTVEPSAPAPTAGKGKGGKGMMDMMMSKRLRQ